MRPDDRFYRKTHEWVKIEGDIGTVGITDYAVSHLSDLVFLDLPDLDTDLMADEPFGEIESVKAVSDLICPLTGTVIEQNEELMGDLALLAKDPFGEGWMIKIRLENKPAERERILDAAGYEKVVQEEEAGH